MPNHNKVVIPEFGDAHTLQVVAGDELTPKAGEVVVEGLFASVNPIDVKTRAGLGWAAESNKDNLPWTPGYDLVGRIVELGVGVSDFAKGDYVAGFIGFPTRGGAYAQRVCIPSEELVAVPNSVTFEAAAALPLAGLTALQAIEKANLTADDSVLILGGAGGVGHIAVQLAVALGAEVYTTCGPNNLDYLSTLGATALNYQLGPASAHLQNIDVLIDLIGGDVAIDAIECLVEDARIVTIPTLSADKVKAAAEHKELIAEGMLVSPNTEQLSQLLDKVGSGALKIDIQKVFALDEVIAAHQQVETGHTRGKVLIDLQALS